MNDQSYNSAIAAHYAAYRPPLHAIILKKVLGEDRSFKNGLDVGCGTGYSAQALSAYCQSVLAIDPSQSMLDQAVAHPGITYRAGKLSTLSLSQATVDITTFAGSLYYAHSPALITSLKSVCQKEALIIVYDFRILLADTLQELGITANQIASKYDYTINFSGQTGFDEIVADIETIELAVDAVSFAHILLAEGHLYPAFQDKYATRDPFPNVTAELKSLRQDHFLKARIYFAKYQLREK